jgi:hypothetical protein
MRKFWLISAGLVAVSGSIFADTIWTGSAGSLTAIPGPTSNAFVTTQTPWTGASVNVTNAQVPFWNNPSGDSVGLKIANVANVGDVLAGLATGTNLIGGNLSGTPAGSGPPNTATTINGSYFANSGGNGDPISASAPTSIPGLGTETVTPALEFSFMSNANALTASVLFADSTLNTGVTGTSTVFGTYILANNPSGCGANCQFTPTVVNGDVTNNISGTPGANSSTFGYGASTVYGYYATVCYITSGSTCTASITYTTGAGNFTSGNFSSSPSELAGLAWNHFAFFELASGEMVFGFEDSPWGPSSVNSTEGIGDFNDVIFAVNGNPPFGPSAPEPGTIAIMGLGLAGLGIMGRRRFAKK